MYKLGPGPDSDATQPGSDSEKINSRMISMFITIGPMIKL